MNDSSEPAPTSEPIETLDAIIGFFATEPKPSRTRDGVPKIYARYGTERFVHDPETGGTIKEEPTFHALTAYWGAAETILAQYRKGDSFIAQGVVRVSKQTGKERFEVKQIGHNTRRTRYTVDRSPRAEQRATEHTAMRQALSAAQEHSTAVSAHPEPHRTTHVSAASVGVSR